MGAIKKISQLPAITTTVAGGDLVALSGDFLDATEILNDYNNFWKVKYPSLP